MGKFCFAYDRCKDQARGAKWPQKESVQVWPDLSIGLADFLAEGIHHYQKRF